MFINKLARYSNLFLEKNPACTEKQKNYRITKKTMSQISESLSTGLPALFPIVPTFHFIPSETTLEENLTPFRKQS